MPHAFRSFVRAPRAVIAAACTVAIAAAGLGLAAPATAASTATAAAAATGNAAPPAKGAAKAASRADHTVTLITGDRVHVHTLPGGKQTVEVDTVTPGAGYRTATVRGDLLVIPDAVRRYLAAGVLDRDLFNVTRLIADGYDDAHVTATPVILEMQKGPQAFSASAPVPGIDVGRPLASIDGAAATAAHGDAAATWAALTSGPTTFDATPSLAGGIAAIHLDGKVKATLDTSVPWVGAPHAWAEGLTGTGVTVAVLDTGYDPTHPDLAGRVSADSQSFVPGEEVANDVVGHGTHVSSTIAGTGAASGGKYRGVADGTTLLEGKVLGSDGSGQDSWVIAGMEWAAKHAPIVSMSLSSDTPSDGASLMDQALNSLSESTGALFIVAAGNDGLPERMGAPGSAADALTVGSVDDPSGALSWFSNQGPLAGSGALKPDITAPGNDITAARSAQSPGDGYYVSMSGTSMATPHVAGAAAIVKQQHPDYTGAQLRAAVVSTAKDVGLSSYQAGTGALDVAAAVDTPVVASGSGDFGMLSWGAAPTPVSRTITYTNRSAAAVTVSLSTSFTDTTPGSSGADASGALSLNAKTLDIAAGGTASVTVTADRAALARGTQHSGALVASVNGASVARTALGLITESERYNLTLTASDFAGKPLEAFPILYNLDTGDYVFPDVSGTTTLRLPVGHYSATAFMDVARTPDTLATVYAGDPYITLDKDKTVAFDARKTKQVTADVGKKGLEQLVRRMNLSEGDFENGALVSVWADEMWAQPMDVAKAAHFDFTTRWRLTHTRLNLSIGGTALDVIPLYGSTPLEGRLQSFAVDGGDGSPEALAAAGAKGQVAVVTRSAGISTMQQAADAAAAGVKLLVIANDAEGEFSEWVGGDDGATNVGIPVASISGVQGKAVLADLAKHPRRQVSGSGEPYSSEVWDLARYSANQVPSDLTYRPQNLARVDTTFYGNKGDQVGELRWDLEPTGKYGFGLPMPTERGLVRTDWVDPSVGWYQEVATIAADWVIRDIARHYKPGQQLKTAYFGPIVRPYVGQGYWGPVRVGPGLSLNTPAWSDGGDVEHTGALDMFLPAPAGTMNTDLYVNGALVQTSPWPDINYWDMPEGDAKVRAVVTTTHDGTSLPSSTKTVTEWDFTTSGTSDDWSYRLQPLLQAYYDLGIDPSGKAGTDRKKGAPITIGLQIGHLAGAVRSAPVKDTTVEVRVPGGGWVPVPLTLVSRQTSDAGPAPTSDGFARGRAYVATYSAALPVPDAGGWIDLRVTSSDTAGNSFSQEIERAVEVSAVKGASARG
ncbi:S8 family serine peptidase [Microbacterium sp. ASV49]|uniref:S8 family serine peptidase n=1 Tax=Microbacterium candidum TaxID=3041922 RepID=A0ABT7N0B8_9MICO|nr:S8 family serine peptidase [Microbacterium sp. ASV49]MDL9980153.1 S8 family serine peptidase [Microbacterium sp. ASV49]